MKHTIETATARAIYLGYAGEYIATMAQAWVGRSDAEITEDSRNFNEGFQRSQKYARAAAMEADDNRRNHFIGQAKFA